MNAVRKIDRIEDPWEHMVYRAIYDAAANNLECPSADDLSALINSSSVNTTVKIIQRLEHRKLIEVRRFQRSRQIFVTALGKWTREPKNKSVPWRERTCVTFTRLREDRPDEAIELQRTADRKGITLAEHLRALVWAGAAIQGADLPGQG